MKRTLQTVVALAVTLATAVTFSVAFAQSETENTEHSAMGGLGFRSSDAPIGVRWWITKQVGIDAGVGFRTEKFNYIDFNNVYTDESFSKFSIDVGLPFLLKSWDKVHFLLRPGATYTTQDDTGLFFLYVDAGQAGIKEKYNTYSVTGEFELEVFLAKNASFSASHGAVFRSSKYDVAGAKADTVFETFGSNFTTLGFHIYLWQ